MFDLWYFGVIFFSQYANYINIKNIVYSIDFEYFCGKFLEFLFYMLVKMTQKLKELYSNLGLPESILNSVAGAAVIGLGDDADDAAITARANEKGIADMLKAYQSHADRVRTNAEKANKGKNNAENGESNDETPSWFKTYMDGQSDVQQKLLDRIAALESAQATEAFDAMVTRVGKELNLTDPMLDLCRTGLSSDMDEKTIKDKLGAAKKVLVDNGVKFEDKLSSADESSRRQAEIEAARAWAKEHAAKNSED